MGTLLIIQNIITERIGDPMEGIQMLQKVFQVNGELCACCGVCIDECSIGAIQLTEQQAVIDETRCTQCGDCAKACPNGAIIARMQPVDALPEQALVISTTQNSSTPTCTVLTKTEPSNRSLAELARPVLTFLGHEVAPRMVDVLVNTLEHRLAKPKTTTVESLPPSSRVLTTGRGAKRVRTRYRGGLRG
jgi:ferredoxin